MSGLRIVMMLFMLLSGGLAQASYSSFEGAPRASDDVLDSMRGGFVVSWNGQDFVLPFSIDGIERLTQINGQTYLNGELMTAAFNSRALTPFTQTGPVSVSVQSVVPVNVQAAVSQPVVQPMARPLAQTASSPDGTSGGASGGVGSAGTGAGDGTAATSNVPVPVSPPITQVTTNEGTGAGDGTAAISNVPVPVSPPITQVTTNGSLIVIQNGPGNTVELPAHLSADSLSTFIQNSVNSQVIRNITMLNITLNAQMLAVQARLNALSQSLNNLR